MFAVAGSVVLVAPAMERQHSTLSGTARCPHINVLGARVEVVALVAPVAVHIGLVVVNVVAVAVQPVLVAVGAVPVAVGAVAVELGAVAVAPLAVGVEARLVVVLVLACVLAAVELPRAVVAPAAGGVSFETVLGLWCLRVLSGLLDGGGECHGAWSVSCGSQTERGRTQGRRGQGESW